MSPFLLHTTLGAILLQYMVHSTMGQDCAQVQKADIVLLVDESSSIKGGDWTKQLEFLTSLTSKFHIGKDNVRFGLICFDHRVRSIFDFDKFSDKKSINKEIKGLKQRKGATETWNAIREAHKMFKDKARKDVSKILIVLTDGQSNGSDGPIKTKAAAANIKKLDVKVVSIGVGMSAFDRELKYMASSDKLVFTVSNMQALLDSGFIEETIVKNVNCVAFSPPPPALEEQQVCKKISKADLVFLVDVSSSIKKEDFDNDVKKFLKSTVSALPIGKDQVVVSMYKFGSKISEVFKLGDKPSADEVKSAVDKVERTGGTTATHLALEKSLRELQARGRQAVKKIVILITDGASSLPKETEKATKKLKTKFPKDLTVVAIGVGKTKDSELRMIASDVKFIKHAGNTKELADQGFINTEVVSTIDCASQ